MIYDIFPFNNELDLLEIRLNTLKDIVDITILTESCYTFSGNEKPLYYVNNKSRFKEFNIINGIIEKLPYSQYTHTKLHRRTNEAFQKNIFEQYVDIKPDDTLIINDVDEIPDPQTLKLIIEKDYKDPLRLRQKFYYYYFNCKSDIDWTSGTVVIRGDKFDTFSSAKSRTAKHELIAEHGGWHFSYSGGVEAIRNKIGVLAGSEFDLDKYKDKEWIQHCIDNQIDIFKRDIQWSIEDPIDVPQYVLDNMDKFGKYFYKGE